jgi:hypothetical protein
VILPTVVNDDAGGRQFDVRRRTVRAIQAAAVDADGDADAALDLRRRGCRRVLLGGLVGRADGVNQSGRV